MQLPRVFLLLLTTLGVRAAATAVPLEESVLIEAVNDVMRIEMPAGHAERAAIRSRLRSPDRLRTGRGSRAELEAPDGTITRLGANTTFGFDRSTRTLQLDGGSVLFHSPAGRGGGTIQSPSASAAVLGTTIIAAATPDGGFKLLVLEGRARVDFPGGATRRLDAGQMTFIRPGAAGTGTPGPVLNFDLAQQVRQSRLVHGFSRALPSRAKIEQAIDSQHRAVGQGQFVATGFLVYAATSDTQVNGIEAAGPDADDKLVGEFTTPQRIALNTDATLRSSQLPAERLFRTPLLVPPSESPFLNKESDVLVTGLLADHLTIDTANLSLSGWAQPEFQLVGKERITFAGSTTFNDLAGVEYLRVFSPQIIVPTGAVFVADFPATAAASTLYFDASVDLTFTGGSVRNPTGGIILQSHAEDLHVTDEALAAGGAIGAATIVPSAVNLDAPLGTVWLIGGTVQTSGGGFAALGRNVAVTGTQLTLQGNFWADAADTARLERLTVHALAPGAVFQTTAVSLLSLRTLSLDSFTEVNLGARTLALEDVHFPAGATVRLVSEQGRLAPAPNTGQSVQPGFVNFVRDVTYAGQPAQDFVPAAVGGTGVHEPAISISQPGP